MATTDEWALLKCDLQEETFTIETTAVSVQTNLLNKVIASYWKTHWLVRTALDQHPFTRSVNISSSHDFRFSGACERKACRRCLDLMTTLVDAVLPTSWHITEWVKTPIWTKQRKPSVFQGNYYEIQFSFLCISLPISKSQTWNSCCERESKCCSLTAAVLADSLCMCPVSLPVLEEEGFTPDLSNGVKNDSFFTDVHGGNWTLSWRQGLVCRDPWRWETGAHQTYTHSWSNFRLLLSNSW